MLPQKSSKVAAVQLNSTPLITFDHSFIPLLVILLQSVSLNIKRNYMLNIINASPKTRKLLLSSISGKFKVHQVPYVSACVSLRLTSVQMLCHRQCTEMASPQYVTSDAAVDQSS